MARANRTVDFAITDSADKVSRKTSFDKLVPTEEQAGRRFKPSTRGKRARINLVPAQPNVTEVKSGLPAHDIPTNWDDYGLYVCHHGHKAKGTLPHKIVAMVLLNSRLPMNKKAAIYSILAEGQWLPFVANEWEINNWESLKVEVSRYRKLCTKIASTGDSQSINANELGRHLLGIKRPYKYMEAFIGWPVVTPQGVPGKIVGVDQVNHRYRVRVDGKIKYVTDQQMNEQGWKRPLEDK